MTRFVPKSLLGQVMLVLLLGLLVGQAVSGVLLYRASEQRRTTAIVHSMAFRLAVSGEVLSRPEARARHEAMRARMAERTGGVPRLPRHARMRVEDSESSPIQPGEQRLTDYEQTLREILRGQGVEVGELVVTQRLAGKDSFVVDKPRVHRRLGGRNWESRKLFVAGLQRADGNWSIVRVPEPRPPRSVLGTIIFQTLVTLLVLIAMLYPLLRRITRPLARLTERVDSFAQNPDRPSPLEESGPHDIRHLIAAHNAMETRIAAMLDEKDVMLGAIGHDLKTPLAALRVRIESVPDDVQRTKMAESIEDITHTLDDILNLARVGRNDGPLEPTDLGALLTSLVGEYADMEQPVELVDAPRVVAPIRATWLRRAVRNLVGNALRYGERARVSLAETENHAVIVVEDDGPGIAEDQIGAMMEPFRRGETSRNRATGGAGLGLTLARAIAEQHGGSLDLTNREEGGLSARIRVPLG